MRSFLMVLSFFSVATPLAAQRDSLVGRVVWVQRTTIRKDPGLKGPVEEVRGDTLMVRVQESGELVTVWQWRPDRRRSLDPPMILSTTR